MKKLNKPKKPKAEYLSRKSNSHIRRTNPAELYAPNGYTRTRWRRPADWKATSIYRAVKRP